MRRELALLVLAASGFACLQWLRWPEPPGLDQSLFVFYGTWLRRGLVLYRDLWDSKPPGLFAIYGLAEPIAGVAHTPRLLDAIAAVATGLLAHRVVQCVPAPPRGNTPGMPLDRRGRSSVTPLAPGGRGPAAPPTRVGPGVAAVFAAFLGCAPLFAGPRVSAQAEVLMAPLLLGAVLASQRQSPRAWLVAGMLLGVAACLKLVALVMLPLAWVFAPTRERWSAQRTMLVLAGWATPLIVCAGWLALAGALAEAVRAVLLFPRAYEAEIASRTPLVTGFANGALWLARGMPLALVLALMGGATRAHRSLARGALVWLGLAMSGAAAQRVTVDYHFFLCSTPLALLAGCGAAWAAAWGGERWRAMRTGSGRDAAALAVVVAAVLSPAAVELRAWREHYTPHLAYRSGRIDREAFLRRLGRPHLLWLEAEQIARAVRAAPPMPGATPHEESLLVWGLSPAVYALAGCRPVTRYAFHQTLLVTGSPLAERWPGVEERRNELVTRVRDDPPRFIVVVHGDRSGFEPRDSAAELKDFPELARVLASQYRPLIATRSYALMERTTSH